MRPRAPDFRTTSPGTSLYADGVDGAYQKSHPRAMPLNAFSEESMVLLAGDDDKILVEKVKSLRNAVGHKEGTFVTKFNEMVSSQ